MRRAPLRHNAGFRPDAAMNSCTELHTRLTTDPDHERFTGTPIDIGDLSPGELGRLWPSLQAALRGPDTEPRRYALACQVLRQAQERTLVPRLDSALLLATLRAVSQKQAAIGWLLAQARYLATGPESVSESASGFASDCASDSASDSAPESALEAALEPLLPPPEQWFAYRHPLLAIARAAGAGGLLARLSGLVRECGVEALPVREFAVLCQVGLPSLFNLARGSCHGLDELGDDTEGDPATALAGEPEYVAFARVALEDAARRVDRIHARELPYEADGAFGHDDAMVLGLAARVAATRDEPWYPDVIARLLPGACVAPTAARTAPSQALTIALGHAVEAAPTPEAILALRQALKVVRHAGLQKKLARHQKPAERGLARRPEVALRLLDAGLEPKQERALLTQFFESGFVRPFAMPYAEWRERLLANDTAAGFARSLVWQAGASFMLGDGDVAVDAAGRPLAIGRDAPVSLWHPVDVEEDEREAWRARIVERKLRQPVRQVFREFYRPPDGDIFAGYELAAVRLIGLARREGWTIGFDCLTRQFGELRAHLALTDDVYPGYDGVVGSLAVGFMRGARRVPLSEAPPRIVSEACRAVDLLVSVSAIALEADAEAGGDPRARARRLLLLADQAGMDAMRRRVIAQLLQTQIAAGRVRLEGFYVHAGGAQVSMRTGRVLRSGTPLELAPPAPARRLRAVPWLPYDEALLERVIHSVGVLLAAEEGGQAV